jgi:hypothetical protein
MAAAALATAGLTTDGRRRPRHGRTHHRWPPPSPRGRYQTTVHAINSAILKLSKQTKAAAVYRGITGATLPTSFFEPNEDGVCGGIEFGFTSTTPDRAVAIGYAANVASTVIEAHMGMIDRGADISWLSQVPAAVLALAVLPAALIQPSSAMGLTEPPPPTQFAHEREVVFPPLMALEVQDTSVEGDILVVSAKHSLNMVSLTLEQVMSKMRRSHVQLVDMLADDLRVAAAPRRALAELDGLKRDAERREPEWFNDGRNFRAATDRALDAQARALTMLAKPALWVDRAAGAGTTVEMRERMRDCAATCARFGDAATAAELLLMGADEAPADGAALVETALAAADVDADAAPRIRMRLRAALPLRDAQPPWPAVLVALFATAGEKGQVALAELTSLCEAQRRFAEGAEVLVSDKKTGNVWVRGRVTRADGSRFDVIAGAFGSLQLPAPRVLRVSQGGAGALLREGATAGCAALVARLLDKGVSPFEADANATTALHCAAAAGHVEACQSLVAKGADGSIKIRSRCLQRLWRGRRGTKRCGASWRKIPPTRRRTRRCEPAPCCLVRRPRAIESGWHEQLISTSRHQQRTV